MTKRKKSPVEWQVTRMIRACPALMERVQVLIPGQQSEQQACLWLHAGLEADLQPDSYADEVADQGQEEQA